MISKQDSNFLKNLNSILEDLSLFENIDKEKILEKNIRDRLNKSLKNYYEELIRSYEYLKIKNDYKLLSKLNRYGDNDV
ncbi:MAG: hypothetical protein H7707_01160 [Acetobacter sp.]|nr:hypothetical protein [Acetobacter sp.]